MKKIFSSTLLIILFPLRVLARVPKNSFVSGLIFGAVFSLVVNVITVQIQETIQKQRILEALEYEIVSNSIRANTIMDGDLNIINKKYKITYYYTYSTYSRDLWVQSSEPLQYLAQLDPEVQTSVSIYYSSTIPDINGILSKLNNLATIELADCYFPKINQTDKESLECESKYISFARDEFNVADDVGKKGFEVLKIFHPTKDRLNSFWLKLLMGDKSTRVLSGK